MRTLETIIGLVMLLCSISLFAANVCCELSVLVMVCNIVNGSFLSYKGTQLALSGLFGDKA